MDRLSKDEKLFWDNLKKEINSDTAFLLKNKKDELALKNILCAIDALAGLYVGREKNGVEKSWFSYIDKVMINVKNVNIKGMRLYFPDLSILYSFHRNERGTRDYKKQDIENCCMLLYPIYRTSAIHDGVLPGSFFITRQKTNGKVWLVDNAVFDYKIGLNVPELFNALRNSIKRFEESFSNDEERVKYFRKRYNFLKDRYILKER